MRKRKGLEITYSECSRLDKSISQNSWPDHHGVELTTWQQEQILEEASEHMPRLEMHERSNEVQPISSGKRNDNLPESLVGFNKA